MRHNFGRVWPAPVATAVLLALVWTVPLWSDPREHPGLTVTANPQLRGEGAVPAAAHDAGFGVDVQVAGVGAGHAVALEVWSEGDWLPEDEGVTDSQGKVHLVASTRPYGRIITDIDGSQVTRTFDAVTAGPVLYWNDEFTTDVLTPEWLAIPQPDDGLTCTMTGDQGVSVMSGQLALTVTEDPRQTCMDGRSPLLINGHLVLRVVIGYGTTAARIKFPRGRVVSGQFWLQPGDPVQRWVMDDEHEGVVIAETRGTGRDPRLGTSVNRATEKRVTSSSQLISSADAPSDGLYHVYAVQWTPAGFSFSIDGEVVREVESATPSPPMTIGLSVLPTKARLPADAEQRTMYVDWLRVWAP